jgi:hypothetical protein
MLVPTSPFPATIDRQRNAMKTAFQAQSQSGWENLMKGRISKEWMGFVERYYKYESGVQALCPGLDSEVHRGTVMLEHIMQWVWKFMQSTMTRNGQNLGAPHRALGKIETRQDQTNYNTFKTAKQDAA